MCDEVKSTRNEPIPQVEQGYSKLYVPDGRSGLADVIKALRQRADMLEALLKSIPEAITPEAHQALHFVAGYVWRNL